MSDTEPDVPRGTAQQSPLVMASSSVSTNAMAMTPGIMPPGKLNVTSTENMAENWKVCKQMWNNYVIIAKLGTQPPEYKVALFLHCTGVDALKIFSGFQFDTPEDRNNLSKIIEKFDQYTIGELNETFERYNFNSRNQEENESIDANVTALRTLAKTCNFCDCMRDSILRDRIVLGVRDKHTRKRLLQERKLDLKKCIDICRSTEATNSQLKTISAAQSEDVHGVKDKQQLPKRCFDRSKENRKLEEKLGKTCKFCGQIHVFERGKCPAWGATCAKCKGRNHFASKCSKVNSLREESEESEESDIECITSITDRPEVVHAIKKEDYPKEIYTEMVVAKKPVKFQVDSGASVNVIPAELAPDEPLKRTTKTLRMWNDTTLQPLGSCRTILQNPKHGKKFSVEFLVVEKQLTPVIGAQAAQQMGLITVNAEHFKIAQPPTG